MKTILGSVVIGTVCAMSAGVVAQEAVPPTSWVGLPVTDPGSSAWPEHIVDSGSICYGDWCFKAVYRQVESPEGAPFPFAPHIVGFLATLDPEVAHGDNIRAVWFQRPPEPGDRWEAVAWQGDDPWAAVQWLKAHLDIPDAQNARFDFLEPVSDERAEPAPYVSGFLADDPVRATLQVEGGKRRELLATMQRKGGAVAVVPLECESPHRTALRLEELALYREWRMIEDHLEKRLGDAARGGGIAWPHPRDPMVAPAPADDDGDSGGISNRNCNPGIEREEWTPTGVLCDCENRGPNAYLNGTFTANAEGEVRFWIPWPPPAGTLITLKAGVGAEVTLALCIWERECCGEAFRQIRFVDADCNEEEYTVIEERRCFQRQFWAIRASADACDRAFLPSEMPRDDQECGLYRPGDEPITVEDVREFLESEPE